MPPPDGGWGWMIVLGGFLMTVIVGGVNRSYGVFYIEVLERFDEGAALSAWLGGLQSFFRLALSPFASALTNRFSVQSVTMVGGIIYGTGYFLSAFANSLGYLYFTYGLLTGIGGTLVYTPGYIIISQYFEKRRGVALSFMSCGAGVGNFIWPPMLHFMLKELSYFETISICAGISFNLVVSGALYFPLPREEDDSKMQLTPDDSKAENSNEDAEEQGAQYLTSNEADECKSSKKKKTLSVFVSTCDKYFNFSVLKDVNILLFYFAVTFYMFGAFSFTNLIVDFACERGVDLDWAAFLLSFEGISQFFSRFLSGFFFDNRYIKPRRAVVWSSSFLTIALFSFLAVACYSFESFAIVVLVFALCKGIIISQLVSVLGDIASKEQLSSAIGFSGLARGIGILVGSVLSGYMKDLTKSYVVSYIVMGCIVTISCFLLVVLNIRLLRRKSDNVTP